MVALFYCFLARALAHHGALGIAGDQWAPLVEQAMLVFLLLLGYAGWVLAERPGESDQRAGIAAAPGLDSRSRAGTGDWLGHRGALRGR